MIEVLPFRAVRYDAQRWGGDLSAVLAPPYDVLDASEKQALLTRDPHNIVAVDLPHVPPKSAGPPEAYTRAATCLHGWLTDGTLIHDVPPALYPYHQRFDHQGSSLTRRMFFARVRLQAFAEGGVLPHERTFGGPKEDRLALMKATRCALSPIFGLFSDPQGEVTSALSSRTSRKPAATATLDGVLNELWAEEDQTVHDTVARIMRPKRIYIADGHHRYTTALMYRDGLRQQHGALAPDDPANFVLFVLVAMEDPGCVILPYFRALESIGLDALLDAWKEGVRPCRSGEASDLVLHDGASAREVGVGFIRRDLMPSLAPDECSAWHGLDYAYLHRYLIDEALSKQGLAKVQYLKSREDAIRAARQHSGVALLVKATPMAQLRAVAEAGGLMPQKSTYFYPKLATGLTILPLDQTLA